MATTGDDTLGHPVLVLSRRMTAALAAQAETNLWSMNAEETTEALRAVTAVSAQAAELEARLIAHAETLDLPDKAGFGGRRGAAKWLAAITHLTGATAAAKVNLSRQGALGEQTRAAMARGEIHLEQGTTITAMLGKLKKAEADTDLVLGPTDLERAEKFLLGEAADRDADQLTTLSKRIIETLDPAGADAHEAKLLEAAEKRAAAKTKLRLRDDEEMTHGTFSIPLAQGSMFRKQLAAFMAPKHVRGTEGAGAYDWKKPTPERRGKAFTEWIESYPGSKLPKLGGLSATVVAVGDYEILLRKVKAARLDTGVAISHEQFIRMAHANGVIPCWMDSTTGKARVMDLGRKQRFHSPDQRLAKTIEVTAAGDPTCETNNCTVPAYLSHLHHGRVSWNDGGGTNLVDAEFRCPYDHHQLHREQNKRKRKRGTRDDGTDPP